MKRTPGVWFGGAAIVVVIAAIAAGLFVIDGPGEARIERFDQARVDNLYTIESALDDAWRRTRAFPASLDSLDTLYPASIFTDPETGEPYPYRVLSDSTAELCATFAQASDTDPRVTIEWSDIGAHPTGPHCFTLRAPSTR